MASRKRSSRSSRRSSRRAGNARARPRVEARNWLSGKVEGFATNHFGSDVDDVRKYVDSLYKTGAKAVYVEDPYNDEWRQGSYGDTLRVVLPADRNKAVKVMAAIGRSQPDRLTVERDGTVRVWWD